MGFDGRWTCQLVERSIYNHIVMLCAKDRSCNLMNEPLSRWFNALAKCVCCACCARSVHAPQNEFTSPNSIDLMPDLETMDVIGLNMLLVSSSSSFNIRFGHAGEQCNMSL